MNKYKKIALAIACGGLLIGATMLSGCGPSKLELDQASQLSALAAEKAVLEAQKLEAQNAVNRLALTVANKDVQIADQTASIEQFRLELSERDQEVLRFAQEVATETEANEGFLIDDIALESSVTTTLSDRDLSLFDGEVEFDSEDYDVEEYISLSGVRADINGNDYSENAYLVLPEGSVRYFVNIESSLDLSDISRDEPLRLNFLGQEIKVVDWSAGEVTVAQGTTIALNEGETYTTSHGEQINVVAVFDGSAVIKVGDVQRRILEGNSAKINGVDIRVNEVNYQNYAGGVHAVELDFGLDVEKTIEDGDEYADESAWEWTVSDHQLGLKLAEAHVDVDTDEDFQPLASGQSLQLPNNAFSVMFVGLDQVDYKRVTFEEDIKSGMTFVEVKGAFVSGMEDFDRLYVNASGIYDEDLALLGTSVELDGTESTLSLVAGSLVVEDVSLPLNFASLSVNGIDVSSEDAKVRSVFGLVVSVPEDVVDDKQLTLQVPEERVFANVRVK